MSLFAQGIEEKLHRVQGDRETLEPAQPCCRGATGGPGKADYARAPPGRLSNF